MPPYPSSHRSLREDAIEKRQEHFITRTRGTFNKKRDNKSSDEKGKRRWLPFVIGIILIQGVQAQGHAFTVFEGAECDTIGTAFSMWGQGEPTGVQREPYLHVAGTTLSSKHLNTMPLLTGCLTRPVPFIQSYLYNFVSMPTTTPIYTRFFNEALFSSSGMLYYDHVSILKTLEADYKYNVFQTATFEILAVLEYKDFLTHTYKGFMLLVFLDFKLDLQHAYDFSNANDWAQKPDPLTQISFSKPNQFFTFYYPHSYKVSGYQFKSSVKKIKFSSSGSQLQDNYSRWEVGPDSRFGMRCNLYVQPSSPSNFAINIKGGSINIDVTSQASPGFHSSSNKYVPLVAMYVTPPSLPTYEQKHIQHKMNIAAGYTGPLYAVEQLYRAETHQHKVYGIGMPRDGDFNLLPILKQGGRVAIFTISLYDPANLPWRDSIHVLMADLSIPHSPTMFLNPHNLIQETERNIWIFTASTSASTIDQIGTQNNRIVVFDLPGIPSCCTFTVSKTGGTAVQVRTRQEDPSYSPLSAVDDISSIVAPLKYQVKEFGAMCASFTPTEFCSLVQRIEIKERSTNAFFAYAATTSSVFKYTSPTTEDGIMNFPAASSGTRQILNNGKKSLVVGFSKHATYVMSASTMPNAFGPGVYWSNLIFGIKQTLDTATITGTLSDQLTQTMSWSCTLQSISPSLYEILSFPQSTQVVQVAITGYQPNYTFDLPFINNFGISHFCQGNGCVCVIPVTFGMWNPNKINFFFKTDSVVTVQVNPVTEPFYWSYQTEIKHFNQNLNRNIISSNNGPMFLLPALFFLGVAPPTSGLSAFRFQAYQLTSNLIRDPNLVDQFFSTSQFSYIKCAPTDEYSLAASPLVIDMDTQNFPFTLPRSSFVTNSNWATTGRKVNIRLMKYSLPGVQDISFVDVPWLPSGQGLFDLGSVLTVADRTNQQLELLVTLMDCSFYEDTVVFDSTFPAIQTTFEQQALRPKIFTLSATITSCGNENLIAVTLERHIFVQKNKKEKGQKIVTLLTEAEVLGLFSNPVNPLCSIKRWYIAASVFVELSPTDPTYLRMNQQTRVSYLGPMQVQTTLAQGRMDFSFRIGIWLRNTFSPNKVVSTAQATVRVTIGCFGLTYLKTFPVAGSQEHSPLFSSDALELLIARQSNSHQMSLNLNDYFVFKSDVEYCGAESITGFKDQSLSKMTQISDSSYLLSVVEATGEINPVIKLQYGGDVFQPADIYLEAKAGLLKAYLSVRFNVCSDKPKVLGSEVAEVKVSNSASNKKYDLWKEFEFTPLLKDCEGYEFSISSTSIRKVTDKISDSTLEVSLKEARDFIVILKATKSLETVSKKFIVSVVPAGPQFDEQLPILLQVSVTIDENGLLEQERRFSYVSPRAIHPDDQRIVMMINGLEGIPFAVVTQTRDNRFEFKINRSQVKMSKNFYMLIKLGDRANSITKVEILRVEVTFQSRFVRKAKEEENQKVKKIEKIYLSPILNNTDKHPFLAENKYREFQSQATFLQYDIVGWNPDIKANQTSQEFYVEPPSLKVEKINRNGKAIIKFNQPLIVPKFYLQGHMNLTNFGTRDMATNQTIAFDQDVLRLSYILINDNDRQQVDFNYTLLNWTSSGMALKINFYEPLLVSEGAIKDQMRFSVVNRTFFVSNQTGLMIPKNRTNQWKELPAQLPHSQDAESLKETAYEIVAVLTAGMIIQFILQFLFKSLMGFILVYYFALQFQTYIPYYSIGFPASFMIFQQEIQNLIEFRLINPLVLIPILLPEYDFKFFLDKLSNKENLDLEIGNLWQELEMLFVLLALVPLLLITITALLLVPQLRAKSKHLLFQLRDSFIWTGTINSFKTSFLKIGIASGFQLMVTLQTPKYEVSLVSCLFIWAILVIGTTWSFMFVAKMKDKLFDAYKESESSMKKTKQFDFGSKWNIFYSELNIKYSQNFLYFQPAFLLRRLAFLVIPIMFIHHQGLQIISLVQLHLFYFMCVAGQNTFTFMHRRRIEIFNEVIFGFSIYCMIVFSEFNKNPQLKHNTGIFLNCLILFMLVVNMGLIFQEMIDQKIHNKKMAEAKKSKQRFANEWLMSAELNALEVQHTLSQKPLSSRYQFVRLNQQEEQKVIFENSNVINLEAQQKPKEALIIRAVKKKTSDSLEIKQNLSLPNEKKKTQIEKNSKKEQLSLIDEESKEAESVRSSQRSKRSRSKRSRSKSKGKKLKSDRHGNDEPIDFQQEEEKEFNSTLKKQPTIVVEGPNYIQQDFKRRKGFLPGHVPMSAFEVELPESQEVKLDDKVLRKPKTDFESPEWKRLLQEESKYNSAMKRHKQDSYLNAEPNREALDKCLEDFKLCQENGDKQGKKKRKGKKKGSRLSSKQLNQRSVSNHSSVSQIADEEMGITQERKPKWKFPRKKY